MDLDFTKLMYSENDIEILFEKIRKKSYPELSSKVFNKEMFLLGYSSPFNGNIYVNLRRINKYKLTKNSLIGLLAHELAHQISYKNRSFFSNVSFLWNYWFSIKKRSMVEKETDIIAIQRGYGKEIIAERLQSDSRYKNDPKGLEAVRKLYLGPSQIKALIKKYSK